MVMVVVATITIVVAVVTVIVAPFFVAVIIVTRWAIGLRNLGDVIPMPLMSLFSVGVLIGHL